MRARPAACCLGLRSRKPVRLGGSLGSLKAVELDPKRLVTLAAIAEHGGIAAAARVLGTTPSAARPSSTAVPG
jgi:hypothetical protein